MGGAEEQGDLFYSKREDFEGLYDAQLSLPLPFVGAPRPFTTVVKRDGREELFDTQKIAQAIFKAAQTVGGQDFSLAESLASAVAIYLTKRVVNTSPTVDQVHDAVERVLIQMSHARTALAYARYRDRRARIRRLREGDTRLLLSELEEARHERDALGGHKDAVLSVRTSSDTLTHWDRTRIVEALVRETGLERGVAELVALEVEKQILGADIRTLTTSLVRELVGAKLVEHGLSEYRERHRRLGVPLYDTERIVRGATPETVCQDPGATDYALARAVKREYALAQVFSAPVTEAHLRGEIHLHHLGFVDRLHSAVHSPAYVAQYGLEVAGGRRFAQPPRHAYTFLAQLAKCGALCRAYFARPVAWDAVNVFFAPFISEMNEEEMAQFAQMLVYEFAYGSTLPGEEGAPTVLSLCWTVPPWLRQKEAVGSGGQGTGRNYGDYEHTAQQFAWAVLDVFRKNAENGVPFAGLIPEFQLGADFFRAPGHEEFLEQVARLVAQHKESYMAFDRGERDTLNTERHAWQPSHVALHEVSVNLARAAYETGKEAALMERLPQLVRLAAGAHEEKRRLVEGLAGEDGGGLLALLAMRRGEAPLVDVGAGLCLVSVEGLNECVQVLLNAELHDSEEAAALGERILVRMQDACAAEGARRKLRLALSQNNDPRVSVRFATLDAQCFPKTAPTAVKTDAKTQAMHYTTGVRLNLTHLLNPVEAARLEGRYHGLLEAGAVSEVMLPAEEPGYRAIADCVRKIYQGTGNGRILLR